MNENITLPTTITCAARRRRRERSRDESRELPLGEELSPGGSGAAMRGASASAPGYICTHRSRSKSRLRFYRVLDFNGSRPRDATAGAKRRSRGGTLSAIGLLFVDRSRFAEFFERHLALGNMIELPLRGTDDQFGSDVVLGRSFGGRCR